MFKPFLTLDAYIEDADYKSRVAISLDDICFVSIEPTDQKIEQSDAAVRVLSLAHGMLLETLPHARIQEIVAALKAKTDEGRLASSGYWASGCGLWVNPATLVGLAGDVQKPTPHPGVNLTFRGASGLTQDYRFRHEFHDQAASLFHDLIRLLNDAARNRWLAAQGRA